LTNPHGRIKPLCFQLIETVNFAAEALASIEPVIVCFSRNMDNTKKGLFDVFQPQCFNSTNWKNWIAVIDQWRYHYPEFDQTQGFVKLPSKQLSDALLDNE